MKSLEWIVLCLFCLGTTAVLAEQSNESLSCDDQQTIFKTLTTVEKCTFSRDCSGDGEFINYMAWHWCTMESIAWLSIVVLAAYLIFLFYIIAGTTDDYLVPAVAVGVDNLKISPNVAGATFLAFANGAPDVFTSIVAFSNGENDLGMGSILGSGVFVLSATLGVVVLFANEIETYRRPLIRDVFAYSSGIVLLLYVYQDGVAQVSESVMFLVFYVIYALVVVVGRFVYQRYMKPRNQAKQLDGILVPSQLDIHVMSQKTTEGEIRAPTTPAALSESSLQELDHTRHSMSQCLRKTPRGSQLSSFVAEEPDLSLFQQLTAWNDKTVLGRVLTIIEFPFTILRRLTIPLVEQDTWNRMFSVLSFFFAPLFVLFISVTPSLPVFLAVCGFGLLAAALAWWITDEHLPSRKPIRLLFVLVAFVVSAIWAFVIAREIVAVMLTIGLGVGISYGVLGVSVLAWGNSIGDFVSNTALAKNGHGRMAVAACFGGPIFNVLFGTGISFLLGTIAAYPKPMPLSTDVVATYGFVFVAICLASNLFFVVINGFKFVKLHAIDLICFYFVFLVLVVLSEAGVIGSLF